MKQTNHRLSLTILMRGIAMEKNRRNQCVVLLATFAMLAIWLGSAAAQPSGETSAAIQNTRSALQQYVETQRIISQEKRDLELAKEMLNERIELVQSEIESLRGKIDEAQESIAEADKKRAEMMEENDKLKQSSDVLAAFLVTLENHTRTLLTKLPAPIHERVKPLSQRIPENPEETKLSLSERFQNVIGILNEINKFNREITLVSEVRDLPDGSSAEVSTLYLGIGQAYYTGANGAIGGLGVSTDEGWVWKPADHAAGKIAQTIAILQNEQVASFVRLPVEIQ